LHSVKSDLSTAHAAMGGLGAMGMADARRGGAVGTATGGGGGVGGAGMPPGLDGTDSSESSDHKVRSLSLLVEEAKKESRWLRERNQELERVVEALRKTIMRQAELSSQRQDQQGTGPGQRPPSHVHRGGRQQLQEHPSSYGTTAGFPAGAPGRRWRQGWRRVSPPLPPPSSAAVSSINCLEQAARGVSTGRSAAAAAAGISRGGMSARSHLHQMQQHAAEAPGPARRYTTHEGYDDNLHYLPSTNATPSLRQRGDSLHSHISSSSSSNRGGGGGVGTSGGHGGAGGGGVVQHGGGGGGG
ncbi:unnamed protein product, partial [Ectocarpus fasciculatus]